MRVSVAVSVLLAFCGATAMMTAAAHAQDAPAAAPTANEPEKPTTHHPKRRIAKPAEKPQTAAAPAPAAPAPTPASPPAAVPTAPSPLQPPPPPAVSPPDIAARLTQNGAGTCAAQVDALAAGTMAGVAQFNTVSNWATAGGDKRLVAVSIGQKYPDGSGVPYGATAVIAAPNGQGNCDAVAVQVVPSPLPCAKLRESLAVNGKQIGDLAGVPLMQDAAGQSMLVSTAANTCVIVGVRAAYAR